MFFFSLSLKLIFSLSFFFEWLSGLWCSGETMSQHVMTSWESEKETFFDWRKFIGSVTLAVVWQFIFHNPMILAVNNELRAVFELKKSTFSIISTAVGPNKEPWNPGEFGKTGIFVFLVAKLHVLEVRTYITEQQWLPCSSHTELQLLTEEISGSTTTE